MGVAWSVDQYFFLNISNFYNLTPFTNDVVPTLVCRIDLQGKINVELEKFLKNIKCAGQNRRAGGNFSPKSINLQTKIRPCRRDFFLNIM